MSEHQLLLDAILAAQMRPPEEGGGDEAYTAVELADELDWSEGKVRRHLRKLKKEGKLEIVWVWKDNISTELTGRRDRRPGYKIIS